MAHQYSKHDDVIKQKSQQSPDLTRKTWRTFWSRIIKSPRRNSPRWRTDVRTRARNRLIDNNGGTLIAKKIGAASQNYRSCLLFGGFVCIKFLRTGLRMRTPVPTITPLLDFPSSLFLVEFQDESDRHQI